MESWIKLYILLQMKKKLNIVVLDSYTLNPGDLSWESLAELGNCKIFDRSTKPELVVSRAKNAEIVLTNKSILGSKAINTLPKLRYIGILATGYNVIDVPACRERGIVVTNVPDYGTDSVAQMTFALILELVRHVGEHSRAAKNGRWPKSRDFCYWDFPLVELTGLKLGIIGFGRIGKRVAQIAGAFGMAILAFDPDLKISSANVKSVSLDTIFKQSDIISLHCPLTTKTKALVNASRLSMMKQTTFLINAARGPLIDEKALAKALNANRIAGAGVDVLSTEPPDPANPLLTAKNCIVTPHIAWATRSARQRLMEIAVGNVNAFIKGNPRNVIS